jgi:hypothetical protein
MWRLITARVYARRKGKMKRFSLVFVFAAILAGGAFAQEKKNFLSGTLGIVDLGIHYERMITPKFSLGAEIYLESFFVFWNTMGVKALTRMYPRAGQFFMELGFGRGLYFGLQFDRDEYAYSSGGLVVIEGFLVEPGFGWKIDFNEPGGFFIEPALSVPVVLGSKRFTTDMGGLETSFGAGYNVRLRIALGGAF